MIVAVPPATPVNVPEAEPIDATKLLLLVHVPPLAASVSVTVDPIHVAALPNIAVGNAFTVTTAEAAHPVDANV